MGKRATRDDPGENYNQPSTRWRGRKIFAPAVCRQWAFLGDPVNQNSLNRKDENYEKSDCMDDVAGPFGPGGAGDCHSPGGGGENGVAGTRTGRTKAKVRGATDAAAEARNLLTEARNTTVSDVRTAMASLRSAKDQLLLQRENAELVRRNRDLVEKEYATGQTSLVRLNEAQRNLIQARGRLALARVSLRQARQGLKAATGEILAPFEVEGF